MKRVFRRLAALAVFTALAAASASAQSIVYWHWNNPDRHQVMEPLYELFSEETGIAVETRQVAWAELYEQLVVAIAGGLAPDVTSLSDWAPTLAYQGGLEDLRPYLARGGYDSSDLLPNALEMWQLPDGFQFGFPFDLDLQALFYNKPIFDNAGLPYPGENMDWTSTLETARRLTIDRDGDGQADQYGFSNGHISWDAFVWANGGNLLTSDLSGSALHEPPARAALEFFREISAPDANMAWGEAARFGYPHPPAAFGGGLIAMYPLGAWAPSAFWQDLQTGAWRTEFDVTHLPMSPTGGRAVHINGQGIGILAASQNKEAAWEFVKFMASPAVQIVSGRGLGQFPILRSVALSDAFIVPGQPPENMRVFVEATEYARPHPRIENWSRVWSIMTREIGSYVAGNQALTPALEAIDRLVRTELQGD